MNESRDAPHHNKINISIHQRLQQRARLKRSTKILSSSASVLTNEVCEFQTPLNSLIRAQFEVPLV